MLDVPQYRLKETNPFNWRKLEWNEASITETIVQMFSCGEPYGLTLESMSIHPKEKEETGELKKTKSKVIDINLIYKDPTNAEAEPEKIPLSYDCPWLIDNHFFVGGNYKVCVYQLFDKPIIARKNLIKIRTNIRSFAVEHKESTRAKYKYVAQFSMKAKTPFARYIIAYLGVEEARKRFNLDENNDYIPQHDGDQPSELTMDVIHVLKDGAIDKARLLAGEYSKMTDQQVIDDIMLVTKIDLFSKRYFYTDNVIEEFIYAIQNPVYDDMDYSNKRVRFAEQIIYCHLCKDIYNLITSIRRQRKLKVNINSKVILSNVNVSSIVQFDNSLNPLSELALLTRTSLTGTGGFKKDNVPQDLRELHPTQKYLFDPCDTADRDGCGTIQYLKPNVEFGQDGSLHTDNHVLNSVAVSFVPFLEHDDATRLQMSSSQQRHAIMLKNFDTANIQSGVEGMFTDQTSFIFRAKYDGKVIYMDGDIIAVQYDNKSCEAYNIGYRKLYISTVDFYKIYKDVGQSFRKGDIIAESNYTKNGKICLGRNLLTAVTPWHGYNYEDGIVISQRLVDEDVFTSVHYEDVILDLPLNKVLVNLNEEDYQNYNPLPKIGDRVNRGDVIAKIKSIDNETYDETMFEPIEEHTSPETGIVSDIKVYANKWNKRFPQFDQFITNLIKQRKQKKTNIYDKLSHHLTKEELDRVSSLLEINQMDKNNYKIKGDFIDGLRIEITIIYERKITVGDKIANRHGNKGVISKIVPVDQMPRLPDGRHVDIVLNPLGIVSRMNIGQVYEAHLSMALNELRKHVKEMYDAGKTAKEIYDYVLGFIKIIDKTADNNYTTQMESILASIPIKLFVDNISTFYIIQPPFESIGWDELNKALQYTNTQWTYKIFDPTINQEIENPVTVGYMYFMKLNHIAQDKLAYRGIGPYSAKTSQPLGGKSRMGGQRLGEMEVWAMIAHGAEKNLNECISTKSDSIRQRNAYLSHMMHNEELLEAGSDDDDVPQALRLLQVNLKAIGLDYELYEPGLVHSDERPSEEGHEVIVEESNEIPLDTIDDDDLDSALETLEPEAATENPDSGETEENVKDEDDNDGKLDLSDFCIGQGKFVQTDYNDQDQETTVEGETND